MSKKLSIDLIQAFAAATSTTCEQMLKHRPEVGKPYMTDPGSRVYGVSGIIGISGDMRGLVVLTMPDDTAVKVVAAFAGITASKVNSDVIDGVMEINNIIVGSAKAKLAEKGYTFEIGLPKMVVGHVYTSDLGSSTRVIVIPFKLPFGDFILDVSLKPAEGEK